MLYITSYEPETQKTTMSMVGMKAIGDDRNFLETGSSHESVEEKRGRSTLPYVTDDSENANAEHKSLVGSMNAASKSTITGGTTMKLAGKAINKNLKEEQKLDPKLVEGRVNWIHTVLSVFHDEEDVEDNIDSQLRFVNAMRTNRKPRDFLASLIQHFFPKNDTKSLSFFQECFKDGCMILKEHKPRYGQRKRKSNALFIAIFKLIAHEVEQSKDEGIQEKFVEAFKDENSFVEGLVKELDKTDAIEERMGVLRERPESGKTEEVVTGDINNAVIKLLELFKDDNDIETTKVLKVFQEKDGRLSLGISHTRLHQKLKKENKEQIVVPKNGFKCGTKTFTRKDEKYSRTGEATGGATCVLVPLRSLKKEVRSKVLSEELRKTVSDWTEYEESEEEDTVDDSLPVLGDFLKSQDYPGLTQSQTTETLDTCVICGYNTRSKEQLNVHMKNHETCKDCGLKFLKNDELENHMVEHMKKKCNICKRSFPIAENDSHMEWHTTIVKFKEVLKKPKITKKMKCNDNEKKKPTKTGYSIFLTNEHPKIKSVNKNWNYMDINKECGRLWKAMTEECRNKYKEEARIINEKDVNEVTTRTGAVEYEENIEEKVTAEMDTSNDAFVADNNEDVTVTTSYTDMENEELIENTLEETEAGVANINVEAENITPTDFESVLQVSITYY